MDDDSPAPEVETAEPAPVHTLDAHMAPYLARLGQIGTVSVADLRGFYSALRSAFLAHMNNPVHYDVVTEETQARFDAAHGAQPEPTEEEAKLFS